MVGTSKVLTVSYGTFSCTLEGFDDPFSTMKMVAEYFRDLAAEDRFFGSEPPTPDPEMLYRIAETTARRRIAAEVQENGVVLRQTSEPAPADIAAAAPSGVAPAEAAPVEDAPLEAAVSAVAPFPDETAQSAEPPAVGIADKPADVDAESLEVAALEAEAAEAVVAETVVAEDRRVEHPDMDATLAGEGAPLMEAVEPADAEPRAEGDRVLADAMIAEVADTANADSIEAIAVSDVPAPVVEWTMPIPLAEVTETARGADAEPATAAIQARDTDAEAEEDDDLAEAEAEGDEATLKAARRERRLRRIQRRRLQREEAARLAAAEAAARIEAEARDEADAEEAIFARLGALTEEDEAPAPAPAPEPEAPAVAAASLSPEQEEDLARELAALTGDEDAFRFPSEAVVEDVAPEEVAQDDAAQETVAQETVAQEAVAQETVAQADVTAAAAEPSETRSADESVADEAEEPAQESGLAAMIQSRRERAAATLDAREIAPGSNAVDRLMLTTRLKMDGPESERRRNAISQLKAAVAATEAERRLVGQDRRREPADLHAYREDFSRAQRRQVALSADDRRQNMREAQADQAAEVSVSEASAAEPRTAVAPRPAPLILVSEQRIDRSAMPAPAANAGGLAERAGAETMEAAAETSASFDEYVGKLGANSLPDMLEAAAAYTSYVEGRPRFSRAQVLSKLTKGEGGTPISREVGLRTFGQLLREGRIVRVQDGQFTIAKSSRYAPEHRIASAARG